MKSKFLEPFYSAIKRIEKLQKYDRYESSYIFRSIAHGEQTKDSDLDVMVIVDKDNNCKERKSHY